MNALIRRAQESPALQQQIIRKAGELIADRRQESVKRWQSCYVLSGIGDRRGLQAVAGALDDPDETIRGVAACALGAFKQPEARSALEKAAETEQVPRVRKDIDKALRGDYRPKARRAPEPGQTARPEQATPEEIRKTSVEEWFRRLENDEKLGYARFTALNALITKAKEGPESKDEVIRRATETIDDQQQNMFKRWQCCYVLSGIGDKRGIPAVTRSLKDQNKTVRGVAACALGAFDDVDATSALEAAAKVEKNPEVLESIQKALKGEYRK
jgi:HEAT repeat protein